MSRSVDSPQPIIKLHTVNFFGGFTRAHIQFARMFAAQGHQRHLSFAWLVADVLAKVRLTRLLAPNVDASISKFSFDPLGDRLTEHIRGFTQHYKLKVDQLRRSLCNAKYLPNEGATQAQRQIYDFCKCHEGLIELLYFIYRWAAKYDLISPLKKSVGDADDMAHSKRPKRVDVKQPEALERLLKSEGPVQYDLVQLLLTFIQFGRGEFFGTTRASSCFLENPARAAATGDIVNLHDQRGGLGRKFALFLEFLASLAFASISEHSFVVFSYEKTFKNGEWRRLHMVGALARALCYMWRLQFERFLGRRIYILSTLLQQQSRYFASLQWPICDCERRRRAIATIAGRC